MGLGDVPAWPEEDPPLDLVAAEDTVASAPAIRLIMPERGRIDAAVRALVG
ncbi:hypothetical protein [Streptomyces sp. NPDC059872]|uniref:hypothetical protein n=1 Tax=Streptomyces sp. NPDC059872 TaxID=3346981 RepID=UPI003658C3B0